MMALRRLLPIVLLLLLAQPGAAQQPGSIQGIVTKHGSNEPVSRATIQLQDASGGNGVVTTTANDGRFTFRNLPAGRYRVVSSRQGFLTTAYGQTSRNAPGLTVTVAAGQQVSGLRIEMQATGTISGHIYDRSGVPLTHATVQALKASYVGDQRSFTVEKVTTTNDRGEYRLFWLEPGQYFIVAASNDADAPPGWRMEVPTNGLPADRVQFHENMALAGSSAMPPVAQRRRTIAPPTYFPGVISPEAATGINVAAGTEVGGIDLSIFTDVAGFRVRGTVTGASETASPRVSFTRLPFRGITSGTAGGNTGSSFSVGPLMPGSYMFMAAADGMMGYASVEVSNADVNNIMIRLTPGVDVAGRVVFEGPPPSEARVALVAEVPMVLGGVPFRTPSGIVDADGNFLVSGITPGDYQLVFGPLLPDQYVKSVESGNTVVLNGIVHVPSFPLPIRVVIGNNPGTLEGRVTGRPNSTVALVPEPALRQRFNLYETAFTDETGGFRIADIAPGNYKVFAWEEVETRAWQHPDFIRAFEDRGIAVRIEEGRTTTVTDVAAVPAR